MVFCGCVFRPHESSVCVYSEGVESLTMKMVGNIEDLRHVSSLPPRLQKGGFICSKSYDHGYCISCRKI